MASYFVYDSINMYRSDNDVNEGRMNTSANPSFTESDSITNHERAADQNIGTTLSALGDRDAIEYAVGSNATADVAAVYFTGDDGVASGTIMEFYIDTDRSALEVKGNLSAISSAGWYVVDLTETTGNKFFIEFKGTPTENVSEILIGKKLNFEIEPDVNVQSSINYENEVQRSLGGVEYAINVNPGQEVFTISFQNISSTFKSDLITMQDANKANAKKMVWFDGTNHHWVRLEAMQFTEIADGRFSTQLKMTQQIQ